MYKHEYSYSAKQFLFKFFFALPVKFVTQVARFIGWQNIVQVFGWQLFFFVGKTK